MARWRAVPTAVSTAVGALAFLASTGLALVLGAGLHVWSGPSAPSVSGGTSLHAPSIVTGRVGGVVTVPPPAAPTGTTPTPAATAPTAALPFVPFVPVAAPAAAAGAAVPAAGTTPPAASTGEDAGAPSRGLGGPAFGLRDLLSRLAGSRLTVSGGDELRPATHVRPAARPVGTARARHLAHAPRHARPHPAAHRPLPHGICVGDDDGDASHAHRAADGHGHGHGHGHGPAAARHHGHRGGHGHGHHRR